MIVDLTRYERAFRARAVLALRVFSAFCALFACGTSSTAIAQYRFDILNTDTGLPQNSVLSILQTRDGYLWFTTLDGLVRYDGARYTVFNKANSKGINSNRFLALYEDTDGTLWIGTEDGGVTHYKDGKFHTYTTADGLPNNYVDNIRRTSENELLVLTADGLARFAGEKFEIVSTDLRSFDSEIGIEGPSGVIWYRIGTELRRVRNGKVTSYSVPNGGRPVTGFNQLYEDRQGRLWIGSSIDSPGELWMLKDEKVTRYTMQAGVFGYNVLEFCEDHEGTMWFGTSNGLVRLKDDKFTTYTTAQGLSSNAIDSIYEDREGTLWVGTRDNGITRITRQIITTLSEKDGLKGKIFYPIIEDRSGSIWIGNFGVNRLKDGKFTYYPLNSAPQYSRNLFPAQVRSFCEDREGRLWIGQTPGLYLFHNGKLTHDQSISTRESPYSIFQDSLGAFWLGYGGYLTRYYNGDVKHFTENDGLKDLVQPIYEDRKGRIWIGSYGGLAQYVDDHLVFLTEKDGLSSNRIRAIYEDEDGVVWIGTYDGGLNRFKDGKFVSFTMKEGMFSNGVFAILEDERGNFWMSSNQGIYRVRRQQLNDFADGKINRIDSVSYGKADGMLNTECNGGRHPSAIKARDGRMWFPTFDGVAVVDPQAVTFNDQPPPVVIENLILDREEMDARRPLEIRPGKDDLEIHYTGLSFIKSEHMRFRYRLEGLNPEWIDAGNRRVAYYTHLPAGQYTFRVIAANSDGVWNQEGAAIRITVIPPFWQRIWFSALVTLLIVASIALVVRVRIKKLQRAKEAQEAFSRQLLASQEQERKRIATGLHDSLGQQLLVIKNWAMIELSTANEDNSSREGLTEISTTASQAIEEVREIIYDLRPYQLDKIGLASTLQFMIEKVAAASQIEFDISIGEIDDLLSHDSEITLYRIVQECVNNIVKHSKATRARVTIERDGNRIDIMIEDNGCGFSTDVVKTGDSHRGGLGLTGMSERVRILGGKLSIQSSTDAGTKIFISINVEGKA